MTTKSYDVTLGITEFETYDKYMNSYAHDIIFNEDSEMLGIEHKDFTDSLCPLNPIGIFCVCQKNFEDIKYKESDPNNFNQFIDKLEKTWKSGILNKNGRLISKWNIDTQKFEKEDSFKYKNHPADKKLITSYYLLSPYLTMEMMKFYGICTENEIYNRFGRNENDESLLKYYRPEPKKTYRIEGVFEIRNPIMKRKRLSKETYGLGDNDDDVNNIRPGSYLTCYFIEHIETNCNKTKGMIIQEFLCENQVGEHYYKSKCNDKLKNYCKIGLIVDIPYLYNTSIDYGYDFIKEAEDHLEKDGRIDIDKLTENYIRSKKITIKI